MPLTETLASSDPPKRNVLLIMHLIEGRNEHGHRNLPRLNRSICVGASLAFTFVLESFAQLKTYSTEEQIVFTSTWKGERYPDD